jgi:hypothetical protein
VVRRAGHRLLILYRTDRRRKKAWQTRRRLTAPNTGIYPIMKEHRIN